MPSALEKMGRRIERLFAVADGIVEKAGGDIYGADIQTFRRWSQTVRTASELSYFYSLLVKEGVR